MECKFALSLSYRRFDLELIDTLWNVNKGRPVSSSNCTVELIDTLWNVNMRHETCILAFAMN